MSIVKGEFPLSALLSHQLSDRHRSSTELSLVAIDSYQEWKRKVFIEFGLIKSVCLGTSDEAISEEEYLKNLDPKNWKEQDHYAVLGLRSKRFLASDDEIRRNYRKQVLRHHPDKRNDLSSREDVESFYSFWYNFDSWREFSYLDEEDKEKGQDRGERRWIEKQNKLARQKRKKEEMTRIRQLTDNAYTCDPRVQRFKEEDKQRKIQQKLAKEEAKKAKIKEEEEMRRREEEKARKLREEEEERRKTIKEQNKKEKEALKKMKRKERKLLEQIFEDNNYFAQNDAEKVTNLQDFDKVCHFFTLEEIIAFKNSFNELSSLEKKKELFFNEVQKLNNRINKEKEENTLKSSKNSNIEESNDSDSKKWSHDDTQLLIKAVNLFPAGTQSRWEVIAAFITQHSSSGIQRKAKDVLSKAKNLQKLDPSLKDEVNRKAATKVLNNIQHKTTAADEATPSERYESPAELQGLNLEPWSNEEQKLLEQALKTYPASTVDRWDRIAECIPTRSKKDCMKRYKELVELVKAKKAAQEAVQKVKKT
ncbi:dnaJ subfamily C member 2-like protein [Dinothrombium tinctorium]|uniref:DnaJ subfamily C member 2-like protein n=1 Tax=Dinothrombium tinctorium TaxID=1965070 RepID=A0A443RKZ3_9ACAR|nr:dnaJ subfamily C member 2-like protein [Dinothrombium tinctorium]